MSTTQPTATTPPLGPIEAVSTIVAHEFYRLGDTDRSRLVEFTLALRSIRRERGAVTSRDLIRAGFSEPEQRRHMPNATRVLQLLAASQGTAGALDHAAA